MSSIENQVVLVTGASGYIASHIVKHLADKGAIVRGTVRNLSDETKVDFLKGICKDAKHSLQLVEADLLNEESWKSAVEGCKYVIHVASPFPLGLPNNPDDLIKPAVDGTLAVLKACAATPSVRRVVLTSSIAAVYDATSAWPKDKEPGSEFDETFWTDSDDINLEPYAKSKTLAEKAAWDYVKEVPEGENKFEFVVVNPGLVLGPVLSASTSTSVTLVRNLLDRSVPAVAKLYLAITDVRDVATAHANALTAPAAVGERHIIVAEGVWMKQIALILQKEFKQQGFNIPTLQAPNFFVWINSLIEKSYKIVVPRLGRQVNYSNKRMIDVLDVQPTSVEKTIIDTANSLIEFGVVKPKSKKLKKQAANESGDSAVTNGEASEENEKQKEFEPEEKELNKIESVQQQEVAATN